MKNPLDSLWGTVISGFVLTADPLVHRPFDRFARDGSGRVRCRSTIGSFAGFTSWPASCGSACSGSSTSSTSPRSKRQPQPARPGQSRSTSCRARSSGFAGARSRRGSSASRCSAIFNGRRHQRHSRRPSGLQGAMAPIGFGAWLGTIMLLNVWGLIWPNQKKILGLRPGYRRSEGKSTPLAFLASRTNTMLSIPMLFFMATGPRRMGQGNLPLDFPSSRRKNELADVGARLQSSVSLGGALERIDRVDQPARSPRAWEAAAKCASRVARAIAAFSSAAARTQDSSRESRRASQGAARDRARRGDRAE